jgi:hypothetical protein
MNCIEPFCFVSARRRRRRSANLPRSRLAQNLASVDVLDVLHVGDSAYQRVETSAKIQFMFQFLPHCLLVLTLPHIVPMKMVGAAQLELPARANRETGSLPGVTSTQAWPRYTLKIDRAWQLNVPGGKSFEASGLLWTHDGQLLTVDDSAVGLYRIQFRQGWHSLDVELLPGLFTQPQLASFQNQKLGPYDCEGIAEDAEGRIYVCEEGNRWILGVHPKTKMLQRLKIDWEPVRKYFHPIDRNASFEGIAIGDGRLYVANERARGRIIVVDFATLKVVDDFMVQPRGSKARDVDYSDLSWFDGALWVLLRESRCVLKVDPAQHRVLAEYDFRGVEDDPEYIYSKRFPTGVMEGLAVDRDSIWLVTDNNNMPRVRFPRDPRPTLFRCLRPDLTSAADPKKSAGTIDP